MSPDIESVLPYDYMVGTEGGYEDIIKPNLENKTLQGKFGNADTCYNLEDSTFDFVYSSHMLEHLEDPYTAFRHWIRICKPGGFIFVSVPHEIFYEKCVWPTKYSVYPSPHLHSWTIEWKLNFLKTKPVPVVVLGAQFAK
jgi:ubiquinone/menaquinone biosynthesis C-methylase UbiE